MLVEYSINGIYTPSSQVYPLEVGEVADVADVAEDPIIDGHQLKQCIYMWADDETDELHASIFVHDQEELIRYTKEG